MDIIRGRLPGALKVVVYGPEGIGKSTFAAQFPDPLFIDTEGSTRYMDVARTPKPTSWPMLLELAGEVIRDPSLCRTLVIDTMDWAELMCTQYVCDKYQKKSIEEFGYGKGYTYLSEEIGRLLNRLSEVAEHGVHVVVTAHAKMRKFEQPDELGAYDRWEMKLSAKTAPLVKEWADLVLFANYKTYAVKTEGGKVKGQGGERRMYTAHHPCWDAKNRFGLAPELPFRYDEIAAVVSAAADTPQPIEPAPQLEPAAVNSAENTTQDVGKTTAPAAPADPAPPAPDDGLVPDIPAGVPQALADLMRTNHVTATDIQTAVSAKGYFPLGMEITDYPAEFVNGCLIGAWDQLYQVILAERKKIPF